MKDIFATRTPAVDAGKFITEQLRDHSDTEILFLLSGGSSITALSNIDTDVLDERITCMMGDEHFVEGSGNNFAQLMQSDFYTDAMELGVQFVDSRVQTKETQDEFYTRLNTALSVHQAKHPKLYTLGLFGVNHDGHTAGIFSRPSKSDFNEVYDVDADLIEIIEPDNEFPKRVTVTPRFIHNCIDKVILFAAGKQEVLLRLSVAQSPHECPAVLLTQHKNSSLFTDAEIPGF